MMKYISPGSWFSLEYPSDWREFEDTEDSFLFYNPDKWMGNFRISAYQGESHTYAQECIDYEMQQSRGVKLVKVGKWSCAYLTESFQENGVWYTSHIWVTGKENISIECSFTVPKGENIKVAEQIIASLNVRGAKDKPWKEIIPVRVLEINAINEAYDWAVSTIKKQLENFGFAFGAILVNEMDGMDWVTVIDGKEEYPALRFAQTDVMVYPSRLIWNKVKNGQPCNLKAEYERIRSEVEAVL